VWGLVVGTTVSTTLLYNGKISGGDWITFNTTVWALIYGVKEVFRIAEGREGYDDYQQKGIRYKV